MSDLVVCSKCKLEKQREEFEANEHLKDGVAPWCMECYSKLIDAKEKGLDSLVELQGLWRKDYSKSYYLVYYDRSNPDRRTRSRHVRRMTHEVIKDALQENLEVKHLRMPNVLLEFMYLYDDLKKTPTWMDFVDELEVKLKRSFKELTPAFSHKDYPELMFCAKNYWASANKRGVFVQNQEIDKSLDLLAAAFSELAHE